jgi:hypothetical protein
MQMEALDSPVPFRDALKFLAQKGVVPSAMTHKDWQSVDAGIRRRSFFSAGNLFEAVLGMLKKQVGELIDPSKQPGEKLDLGTARILP